MKRCDYSNVPKSAETCIYYEIRFYESLPGSGEKISESALFAARCIQAIEGLEGTHN